MRMIVDALLIDTPDPEALAMFYEDLLGYVRTFEDDGEVLIAAPDGTGFPMLFVEADDPKTTKNRLHLDLRPDDQEAAVAGALSLGATRVDIGQDADPDVTWVVLADPDGNEFCILQPGGPGVDPGVEVAEDAVAINVRSPDLGIIDGTDRRAEESEGDDFEDDDFEDDDFEDDWESDDEEEDDE